MKKKKLLKLLWTGLVIIASLALIATSLLPTLSFIFSG
jgi:hypothetical protein